MLSQTTEYALRAVVCLARHWGEAQTAQLIAEETKVPASYLSKVLQSLVRAGLVRSQRGLHGGFVLAVEPEQLRLLDVIEAVEPIKRIHGCPIGIAEHDPALCPLHRRLDQAIATVREAFGATTLAEILSEP